MGKVRLVIIDGNELTRALLKFVLHESSVVEIVGEASDQQSAIATVGKLSPDAVIMGNDFVHDENSSIQSSLQLSFPAVRIIKLSALDKAVLRKTADRAHNKLDMDVLNAVIAGSYSGPA